jgi:hypothetical protein
MTARRSPHRPRDVAPMPFFFWSSVAVAAALALFVVGGLTVGSVTFLRKPQSPNTPALVASPSSPAPRADIKEPETPNTKSPAPAGAQDSPPRETQSMPKLPEPPAAETHPAVGKEVTPPPAAEAPPPVTTNVPLPVPPKPGPFKRRNLLTFEELRKQVLEAPEVGLSPESSQRIFASAKSRNDISQHPTLALLDSTPDLGELPLLRGADCRIGKDSAEALQGLSRKMRVTMAASVDQPGLDPRIRPDTLRRNLLKGEKELNLQLRVSRPAIPPGAVGIAIVDVVGTNTGSLWGTDVYTDDSSVALAAVHAGLLKAGERGLVQVTLLAGQNSYRGSTRNGVTSNSYGAWAGSYKVEAGSALKPEPEKPINKPQVADMQGSEWLQPEAVATLSQMLMAEDRPLRLLMVAMLELIPGREATLALARAAVYDLSPDVREAAVGALRQRGDRAQVRPVFLQGLQHPWPSAADHAAEALVNLGDAESVPDLVGLLGKPSPTAPAKLPDSANAAPIVRELVRVNHLANCVMCHAPSLNQTDPVRGLVPTSGQPVPPTFQPQYYEQGNPNLSFVRADITYLRQDFAVPQPVAKPNHWPENQRYDYLVRTRPATVADWKAANDPIAQANYPQREAVLFALRELTGADQGTKTESWEKGLARP